MKSKKLEFTLILIAALTKPKSWVLGTVSFFALTAFKWVTEGQSIFIDNWRVIFSGMLNPDLPVEQKFFLVGFFCMLTSMSLILINIVKHIAIQIYTRFEIKHKL